MNIDPAIDSTAEADKEPQPSQQIPQPTDSSYTPPEVPVQQPMFTGDEAAVASASAEVDEGEAVDTATALKDVAVFDTVMSSRGKNTTPLPENGGPPVPPLSEGTVVGERYQIVTLIGVVRDTNMYRVTDLQGYRRCWACGSASSMPGDIYCVECGAQLAGRFYRLQEINLAAGDEGPKTDDGVRTATGTGSGSGNGNGAGFYGPESEVSVSISDVDENGQMPVAEDVAEVADVAAETEALPKPLAIKIAPAILENRVAGVAHVYEVWADEESQRGYITWEEASGRTLASWLPESSALDELLSTQSGYLAVPQEPEDEQALAWMLQATELLSRLHDEGIGGCSLELANLLVQPGDRVLLLDPSGCSTSEKMSMAEHDAMELSDVRNMAAELEKWYMVVRKEAPPEEVDSGPLLEGGSSQGRDAEPMVAAYEVTGPLGRNMNPAVALAQAREGSYPTAHAFAEILRDLYEASKPLTNLKLWSGRASDVGRVRKTNEDSVLTLEATVLEHEGNLPVALYVIADGMGGHQSGEVASSIASRTIGAVVNSSLIGPLVAGDPVARDPNTCGRLLQQAILEANRRITDLARERHSDLGTTTVAALLIGNQLTVANVGDSRAYMWHDGGLQVITRDHSLVMQLVMAGQIKPEDIYTHPRRNEIYRALGDPRLTEEEIDIYNQRLRPGDGLLLCSDGLWDFVRDPDIASILSSSDNDPQSLANALVAQGNMNGGEDNISVVFARVMESET